MANNLNSDEEKKLRLFQQRVQDLRECGLVTNGAMTLSVDMQLGRESDDGSIPFEGYDRDHFRSAIQTLRQFTLDKDAVSFFPICKLIRRKSDREELIEWSKYARSYWKQTMSTAPLSFRVGEKLFTVKEALDLMLYGFLSHTKQEAAEEWESLSQGAKATIYFIVQRSLFDLFHCLNTVDSVIMYWLDKPEVKIPQLGNVTCGDIGDTNNDSEEEV